MEEIEEPGEAIEQETPPRRRPYGFVALALILAGAAALIARDRAAITPPPTDCSLCGQLVGEPHEFGCPQERCPYCDRQLATCDCIKSVLKLTEDERDIVDESSNGEFEPLKSIVVRWRAELDKKGRRPVADGE